MVSGCESGLLFLGCSGLFDCLVGLFDVGEVDCFDDLFGGWVDDVVGVVFVYCYSFLNFWKCF